VKSITPVLAIVALLAVYHTAGVLWGRDAKLYFLIGMLVLYALVGLAVFIMRRRLQSDVQGMDEVSREELLREHPEVEEELAPSAGVPWPWRVLDVVLGIVFAFGPPLVVSLARQQPLTWESEFTGYHVLAMAGGVGAYCLGRAYVIRQWRRRHGVSNDNAEPPLSPDV